MLAFDRDKDGRVSLDEWLGRLGAGADPHRAERVTSCFRTRDANGDGFVDVAEVRAKAKEIVEPMDVDRDGRVTPQEWQAQINKPDVGCHH